MFRFLAAITVFAAVVLGVDATPSFLSSSSRYHEAGENALKEITSFLTSPEFTESVHRNVEIARNGRVKKIPQPNDFIRGILDEAIRATHARHNELASDPLYKAPSADSAGCKLCKGLTSALIPLLLTNSSLTIIDSIAVAVCDLIKPDGCRSADNCKDVCTGAVHEYAYEVVLIVTETVLTPAEICYLVKQCPAPTPVPPYTPTLRIRSNLSDHSGEHQWPSSTLTGTGFFMHISDIHLDLQYQEGTNTNCGEPLCCRAHGGPGKLPNETAGYFGDYNCDTSTRTLQSLSDYIATMNPTPDFVLYTGDDPAHDIWEQSRHENVAAIQSVATMLQTSLPNIPVFNALGNHAAFPVNQFEGPVFDSWLYQPSAQAWSDWISNDAARVMSFGGFYATRIRPGLVVVSLHTTMFMKDDYWLIANTTDVGGQLLWLDDVLEQAEYLDERVILIGHAGPKHWYPQFAVSFRAIVAKYRKTVLNLFFGHTHTSSVAVYHDPTDKTPVAVEYVAGSVTTYTYVNPSYRFYKYDRDHFNSQEYLVQDFDHYWLDLNEANANKKADWSVLRYSARDEYDMKDLSPASWQELGESFVKNQNATLLERYTHNIYAGVAQPGGYPGNVEVGCDIVSSTPDESSACAKSVGVTLVEFPKKC